jgi:hypothetical protein
MQQLGYHESLDLALGRKAQTDHPHASEYATEFDGNE